MATLYCDQNMFTSAQYKDSDPAPYFCTGQESESESVSGNVNVAITWWSQQINSTRPIIHLGIKNKCEMSSGYCACLLRSCNTLTRNFCLQIFLRKQYGTDNTLEKIHSIVSRRSPVFRILYPGSYRVAM